MSSAAESHTDAVRERWVGDVLGLSPAAVAAVVDRLGAEDRLPDGLALTVLLHATRRGMDPGPAAEELATGVRALPDAPSAYELRTLRDELEDLLAERTQAWPPAPVGHGPGVPRSGCYLEVASA